VIGNLSVSTPLTLIEESGCWACKELADACSINAAVNVMVTFSRKVSFRTKWMLRNRLGRDYSDRLKCFLKLV
jgi:epoxyqueuosine reductase QueG